MPWKAGALDTKSKTRATLYAVARPPKALKANGNASSMNPVNDTLFRASSWDQRAVQSTCEGGIYEARESWVEMRCAIGHPYAAPPDGVLKVV